MTVCRSRALGACVAALLAACSDDAPPRFIDTVSDGSVVAPDAPVTTCRASADCDDGVGCTRDLCAVGGVCEHVPSDATCVPPTRCTRAADCDDGVACTRDRCLVDGTCQRTPQDELCASGHTCDATRGCSGGTPPVDVPATTVDATAGDAPAPPPPPPPPPPPTCRSDADCDDHLRCTGLERCVGSSCVAGAAVSCDDGNGCTADACAESGATMCTHAAISGCVMVTPMSGDWAITPAVSFACNDEVFKSTVVDVRATSLRIAVTSAGITVTGTPVMLTGPALMGGAFRATGRVAGGCSTALTLSGAFSDARHFTGALELAFAGEDCIFTNCEPQRFALSGEFSM